MRKMTLVQVEVAGIQDYIFGSNDLRQNIGASELVHRATTRWISDTLDTLQPRLAHNIHWDMEEGQVVYSAQSVLKEEVQAEVVYAGGGGALILFAGPPDQYATPFTRSLTKKGLELARGLRLMVEWVTFDLDEKTCPSLADLHIALRQKSGQSKLSQPASTPLPGLAVTAQCVFTGLPAAGRDHEGRLAARSVLQKVVDALDDGNIRLNRVVKNVQRSGLEFAYNFDHIGQRGESSYLAVIHVDGNGMGQRFQAIAKAHKNQEDNAAYLAQVRALSVAVQARAIEALRATVQKLIDLRKGDKILDIPLHKEDGKLHLFFRPIVFGGDDVTFVCDGRVGLDLAAHYLRALADGPLPGETSATSGAPLYSRAGVAIVHTHYPFSRAYEMAEALCRSAKKAADEVVPGKIGCTIDWHIGTTGMVLDLPSIRSREYCSAEHGHSMLMRPLWVERSTDEDPRASRYWRRWRVFQKTVDQFQKGEAWRDHRNKTRDLQEALRQGPQAVEQFCWEYPGMELPKIDQQPMMQSSGWSDTSCGYFDALETLDFYHPLENGGRHG